MKSLPKKPNLEFLKKEAKQLRASHNRADAACCDRIRQCDTSFASKSDRQVLDAPFSVTDAQRIIAREYGYSSWARLKHYVESLDDAVYTGVSDMGAYHQAIVDSYDNRSKVYDNGEWHRGMALKLINDLPPDSGQRVLDVGTGTGTVAFRAAELVGPTGSVTGIDISGGMLAKCAEKLGKSSLDNLDFVYADAERLDYPANSFDRVYSASSFFWMSHPLAALRHWYELLKPNGYAGIHAWPDNSIVWGNLSRQVLRKYGINFTVHQATGSVEKCRELFELAGFENVQVDVVEDGHYITLEDAKDSFIEEGHYSPGQYPHPLKGVSDDILQKAKADFCAALDKLNTDKGIWHDMTMYYVYGQKAADA